MQTETQSTAPSATASPAPPSGSEAAAAPAPTTGAATNEPGFTPTPSNYFEQKGQNQLPPRPEHIPEKFWKDGKPLIDEMAKSYVELERFRGQKLETLKAEVRKELAAEKGEVPAKPEEYKLPEITDFNAEEVASHPLTAWWRETALKNGLTQDQFAEGIGRYLGAIQQSGPNLEAEMKQLGENASVRVDAVKLWAEANFAGEEFDAIARTAQTAAGIKVLERLMGQSTPQSMATERTEALTADKVRQMMNDPRYYAPGRRDPAYVAQVDEAFRKLYG